jgi:hypothetical protein
MIVEAGQDNGGTVVFIATNKDANPGSTIKVTYARWGATNKWSANATIPHSTNQSRWLNSQEECEQWARGIFAVEGTAKMWEYFAQH